MQVLQHQQQRLALRGAAHELAEAVPHVAAGELGRQLDGRRDVREDAPQRRRDTGDLGSDVAKRLPQRQRAARVADRLLDDLDIGQVRRRTAHLHTVPGQHPHPARLGLLADLGHQP